MIVPVPQLDIVQEVEFTDLVDLYLPNPPVAGLLREASDPTYNEEPTYARVRCSLHITRETDTPSTEGRKKPLNLFVLDRFFFHLSQPVQDTWLIRLQTPGHPDRGAYWVVQGNSEDLRSWAMVVCNDKMVLGKRSARPVFALPVDTTQPPPAPTLLTAIPGDTQVALAWNSGGGTTASFTLWQSSDDGNSYQQILSGYTGTSYTDTSLTNDTSYCYYVVASDATGNLSANSNVLCATPLAPSPPGPPTNLLATPGNTLVSLAWDMAAGVTYNVYRGTQSGNETILQSGLSNPSYQDSGLTNGTTYFYYVTAVADTLESSASNEVSATPTGGTENPPAAPSNLVATAGVEEVGLTWTGVSGASGYHVKRSDAGSGEESYFDTTPQTTYTDVLVCDGIEFFYEVSAFNGAGESANSNEASATPLPPPP